MLLKKLIACSLSLGIGLTVVNAQVPEKVSESIIKHVVSPKNTQIIKKVVDPSWMRAISGYRSSVPPYSPVVFTEAIPFVSTTQLQRALYQNRSVFSTLAGLESDFAAASKQYALQRGFQSFPIKDWADRATALFGNAGGYSGWFVFHFEEVAFLASSSRYAGEKSAEAALQDALKQAQTFKKGFLTLVVKGNDRRPKDVLIMDLSNDRWISFNQTKASAIAQQYQQALQKWQLSHPLDYVRLEKQGVLLRQLSNDKYILTRNGITDLLIVDYLHPINWAWRNGLYIKVEGRTVHGPEVSYLDEMNHFSWDLYRPRLDKSKDPLSRDNKFEGQSYKISYAAHKDAPLFEYAAEALLWKKLEEAGLTCQIKDGKLVLPVPAELDIRDASGVRFSEIKDFAFVDTDDEIDDVVECLKDAFSASAALKKAGSKFHVVYDESAQEAFYFFASANRQHSFSTLREVLRFEKGQELAE